MTQMVNVGDMLNGQKIVPVVVVDNKQQALGLAQALLDGGIQVIEITLRNSYGMQAITDVKTAFPEMLTLAGTVNTAQSMLDVMAAGADGVISPGITATLLRTAVDNKIPYLPGVATASEVLTAMEYGLSECKLFPATVVGGVSALKAFSGPLSNMKFCPTGGVGEDNYHAFLALANVMCVGGSWIAPSALIAQADWQGISELCKATLASIDT
jgi:2-dehydro-3-deoxyphosphogluconate aldolase/(4S)-4-hydroxy-2-oxoglutarate aldolase